MADKDGKDSKIGLGADSGIQILSLHPEGIETCSKYCTNTS